MQQPDFIDELAAPLWLCLDTAMMEQKALVEQIYQLEPAPRYCFILHKTPLAELQQASPLLIELKPNTPLLSHALEHWLPQHAGLLIESNADLNAIWQQLFYLYRARNTQGNAVLFRYFQPQIALRFFSAKPGVIGPLARLHLPVVKSAEITQWQSIEGDGESKLVSPYLMDQQDEDILAKAMMDTQVERLAVLSKQQKVAPDAGADDRYDWLYAWVHKQVSLGNTGFDALAQQVSHLADTPTLEAAQQKLAV